MKKKIFSIIAGLLFLLMALLQFTGIIGNVINIAQGMPAARMIPSIIFTTLAFVAWLIAAAVMLFKFDKAWLGLAVLAAEQFIHFVVGMILPRFGYAIGGPGFLEILATVVLAVVILFCTTKKLSGAGKIVSKLWFAPAVVALLAAIVGLIADITTLIRFPGLMQNPMTLISMFTDFDAAFSILAFLVAGFAAFKFYKNSIAVAEETAE